MELTTNNLIKMIIAAVVIVVVILGIYVSMKNYIIPYFSGISFEEPEIDVNSQFGQTLVQDKNIIGRIDSDKFYISNEKGKTDIYYKKGKFYFKEYRSFFGFGSFDILNKDEEIGSVDNQGKVVIASPVEGSDELTGSYKYGNEIYKIGGNDEE